MKKIIQAYIKDNNLFDEKSTIVVGVSGGSDSIALLHVLHDLKYKIILAHVNHNKRMESINEEKAMEKLAKSYNIPFECFQYHHNNSSNFHDDSHNARYNFFKEVAEKYHTNIIATAHHLDDQIETVLIKLINGSNLYGYGGISNKVIERDLIITRPLLCVSKQDILEYINDNNLIYYEDSSNEENEYLRNRIRHNLIPFLKKEEPSILNKIQEFSIQCKEAFDYIRRQSINYLKANNNIIEISSFINLDIVLQKDILCLLFEKYPIRKNNDIINKCLKLIKSANGTKKICLKDNFYFVITYNNAEIKKIPNVIDFKGVLGLDEELFFLEKYHFYFSKKIPENNVKYIKLCYNGLKLPFFVRNKRDGDFINMSYGNKKVSRIFIDLKVPQLKRNECPLVFDADGNLLWVVPYAKSTLVLNQKESGDIYLICEEIYEK